MESTPLPADAARRLEALRRYGLPELAHTGALDDLTGLAATICGTPVSMICLVDGSGQRVVSCRGVELEEGTRDLSFWAHALSEPDVFEVPDALADPRFADDPLVTSGRGFRFYAGAPLRDSDGEVLGTICVIDRGPRHLSPGQREALRALSRQVMTQLELRRQAGLLAESERRLRAIFNTEPECVKLLAADGSLLEMNPAGLRIIEAESFAQVAGQRLDALVAAPHRAVFNRLLTDVFAGRSSTATFQLTTLKGIRRWVESHAAPLRDASGRIVAALGITRDITERVNAEDEIRIQRTALEMAHDAANLGVWQHDLRTGALTLDERAMRHHGLTAPPSSLDALMARVHPDDRSLVDRECRAVIQPEGTGRFATEYRVQHPDGSMRWLSVHLRAMFDDDGETRRAVRAFGTSQDITAAKSAAESLRVSEERLRLAVAAAHLGTFDWDVVTDRLTWSRVHEALWGYAPGEFPGTYQAFAERVHPEDLQPLETVVRRCLTTGGPYEGEFRVVWPDGSVHWMLGRGEFDFAEDGKPLRMRGVVFEATARKAAEAALRENEERFKAAQRETGIGSWRLVPDQPMIAWSDQMYELYQLAPDLPVTVDAALSRIHPDDRQRAAELLAAAISGAVSEVELEHRIVWPDGQVRTIASRGAIHRAGGRVLDVVGTSQDVTEQRRAEKRIVKLNRVYAVLSGINETLVREKQPEEILSNACRIAVSAGRFQMAWIGMAGENAERLEIRAHAGADEGTLAVIRQLIQEDPPAGCGFTAAAFKTGRHAICADIATDPETAAWREAALSRGYHSMASFPLTQQDRVVGTFNIYASEAYAFDRDEVALLDQLAANISFALEMHLRDLEHRRGDAERRQAEERFREVVETIQEVFWITSSSSDEMFYVSPAYETIWGRSCESLYAAPYQWLEAILPEDRERVSHALRTRQNRGSFNEIYRIARPDGTVRWIRDRAFPVRDASGNIIRIVGTAIDITEQRQLEEQFRQAQKMESVGRLAGGIAHDFNNLLTVINGTADLALEALPEGDALRTDLEQILEAGDRAASLIGQLLALSRRQILRPEVINLSTVIGRMRTMLRRLIPENITIRFLLPADLGSVRADPGQIEQVVMNLAVNARDAMPDGGTLTIEAHNTELDASGDEYGVIQSGPQVMVAVSDTGHGMDERTRQHIFEPFFTTKDLGKGTGLGLSTVYGIVQQSGGTVWVGSQPGRGTTFTIYLPRVDDVPRGTPLEPAAALAGGTETILLVEDETALRALAKRVLTSAGYTVLDAEDGAAALRVLQQYGGPVHLTVSDVVMPGMSGRELAERLRKLRPEMKVLYTSGYTDDAILRHGVLDDPMYFIGKPYTPSDLRRRVREILDRD